MSLAIQIVIGLAAVLAIGYLVFTTRSDLTGSDARRLVEDGARLVDVRTAGEFAGGHISGAMNVPVQELAGRVEELSPKEKPIIVYCRSGARSSHAARILKRAGYAQVHNLGSISRW